MFLHRQQQISEREAQKAFPVLSARSMLFSEREEQG
jgi:hypothetical protein